MKEFAGGKNFLDGSNLTTFKRKTFHLKNLFQTLGLVYTKLLKIILRSFLM
jgi:hypothetical protein